MRISRSYNTDDWKSLTFKDEVDWELAVSIFRDRLETRYLEHIRSLLQRKTIGFVVLALDCILVETVQQFRLGTRATPWAKEKKYFVWFLTETAFANHFNANQAELFYETIRCGLLHQAEAEGASRIKRGQNYPLVQYTSDHAGVIINASLFHGLLEQVIEDYALELLNPRAIDLRRAFRRKMNFIARIEEQEAEQPHVDEALNKAE